MANQWKRTEKRVPVVFSQTIAAGGTASISITPSYPFRGETIVIDGVTAAGGTIQIPSVGPNPQIAGGTATAQIPAAAFPPTQTECVRFGMDISEQGNQLTLNAANGSTTVPWAFVAMLFGPVVAQMNEQEQQQHAAAMQRVGLAPAGAYVGMAPASTYSR